MKTIFGNIECDELESIIQTADFQKLWFITKDMIETCKDCELRYMCQDCRAYTKDSRSDFSKPTKCNYNPYEK